ncbi:hypothetical protein HDU76_003635 [Blyttiomyces sp. JEL0837]|nr:hypothetical protein HDU76_003635 [Blyttiomyces sp. JEL0837]
MQLIPKSVQIVVTIDSKPTSSNISDLTTPITPMPKANGVFEWQVERLQDASGQARSSRLSLVLAYATFVVFLNSVPPGNIRVTYRQFNVYFDISELSIDGGVNEAIQNAITSFMSDVKPKTVRTVWSPDLIKHVASAEVLEIFPNANKTLNNFLSIGNAETGCTSLTLRPRIIGSSQFTSLDGVSGLKHLVHLKIDVDALSNWESCLESCRLTKLETVIVRNCLVRQT